MSENFRFSPLRRSENWSLVHLCSPASNTIYCDFEDESGDPCPLSFVPDLGENEERWTVTDAASASQLADNTLNLGTLTFPLV